LVKEEDQGNAAVAAAAVVEEEEAVLRHLAVKAPCHPEAAIREEAARISTVPDPINLESNAGNVIVSGIRQQIAAKVRKIRQ
jgi:hypothetical protein